MEILGGLNACFLYKKGHLRKNFPIITKKKPKSNPMEANVETPITEEALTKHLTHDVDTSTHNPNKNLTHNPNKNLVDYFGKSKEVINTRKYLASNPDQRPSFSAFVSNKFLPKNNSAPKIIKTINPTTSIQNSNLRDSDGFENVNNKKCRQKKCPATCFGTNLY